MDYARFIELLERFFERAGTLFHKKGVDYPAEDGNPSFVIIDEGRNTYYLTEIALPPDIPATDNIMQRSINQYSSVNDMDPFILRLFTVLGESIKTSRFSNIDDPAIDMERLQKKSAVVVADETVPAVNEFIARHGFEHQSVPLKGIFTIYFFTPAASEAIEELYNKVSDIDEGFFTENEDETFADEDKTGDIEADAFEEFEVPDFSDIDSLDMDIDTPDNPEQAETIPFEPAEPDLADPMAGNGEVNGGMDLEIKPEEVLKFEETPVEGSVDLSEFMPKQKKKKKEKPSKEKAVKAAVVEDDEDITAFTCKLGHITENVYSFLLFLPAFVINKLTGGRIPDGISYWIAAICALFGLYYYPLSALFGNLYNAMNVFSYDTISSIVAVAQNQITENLPSAIYSAASWAIYVLLFDKVIMQFMNSGYYLKYLLAFAFALAIVPGFRIFGRRMVCFLLTAYVVYIPLFILGNWLASSLVARFAKETDYEPIVTATGGVLFIALAIPFFTGFFATKLCKGIKDTL